MEPAVLLELTAPDEVTVAVTGWRVDERTVQRTLLDGVLILPPGAAEPLHLNPSAAEIWTALPSLGTADRIAAVLADRHGVEPAAMRAAVDVVVDELVSIGALEAGS